jgi:hypothetical protein
VHRLVIDNRENRTVRAMVNWLTMPGVAKRAGFLLETAFPSPEHLRQRYGSVPGGFWPLLYVRHATAAVSHAARRR